MENGWDRFRSLGHPSKFQPLSHLGFVTAPMCSTEIKKTLQHVWPSAGLVHYIYSCGGSCLLTEFCQLQNSLCVQVLRSPIGNTVLQQRPSAKPCWVHGTRNGITELSQRAPPIFGWAAITFGIGPHSSFNYCTARTCSIINMYVTILVF